MNWIYLVTGAAVSLTAGTVLAQSNESTRNDADYQRGLIADAASQNSGENANFFIASDEEGTRLDIGGLAQFRHISNWRSSSSAGDDDFTSGFESSRTQLWFDGTVHDVWDFRIEGQFDLDGGTFYLNDAYIGSELGENGYVQLGQFILPFSHESTVDDQYQLAVDRSVVDAVFGPGWSQGIQLSWNSDRFRAFGAFSDGFATANTPYISPAEADYALTGRLEWLAAGDFAQFDDYTSINDDSFGLLTGAALHYQDGGSTGFTTDVEMFSYTGDISVENGRWNAAAAVIGRSVETPTSDFDDWGYLVQGGFFATETNEFFGRIDGVQADSARGFANDDFNFLTVGWNRYFAGHAAKFTADVVYSFDATHDLGSFGATGSSSNLGLLGDMDDGETALRLQMQLMF